MIVLKKLRYHQIYYFSPYQAHCVAEEKEIKYYQILNIRNHHVEARNIQ